MTASPLLAGRQRLTRIQHDFRDSLSGRSSYTRARMPAWRRAPAALLWGSHAQRRTPQRRTGRISQLLRRVSCRSGSSPTWFWRCYEPQNDPPRNAALARAAPPTANLANQYFMGSPPWDMTTDVCCHCYATWGKPQGTCPDRALPGGCGSAGPATSERGAGPARRRPAATRSRGCGAPRSARSRPRSRRPA
jgi:hypothetical protein